NGSMGIRLVSLRDALYNEYFRRAAAIVSTAGDAAAPTGAARSAVAELDPDLPLYQGADHGRARTLSAFLVGVSPFDGATFAAVTLAILAAAPAASWIPAHRATRVDPLTALRTE